MINLVEIIPDTKPLETVIDQLNILRRDRDQTLESLLHLQRAGLYLEALLGRRVIQGHAQDKANG